jgi:hypothetical protein
MRRFFEMVGGFGNGCMIPRKNFARTRDIQLAPIDIPERLNDDLINHGRPSVSYCRQSHTQ